MFAAKHLATACRAIRFPFRFNTALLRRDLALITAEQWSHHVNTNDYSGDWTSIALRSPSGKETDNRTHSTDGFQTTPLAGTCAYFTEVIESFLCEKESVRLLLLGPGSLVREHRDRRLGYEYGAFRLHVPLTTDPAVEFVVGGERLPMQGGECWYASFDLPHSVHNRSKAPRVHLVIDCKRNAWSDELFGNNGYDFEAERRLLEPDPETKRRIAEALLLMNTETSRAIARDLQQGAGADAK
jgi:hypothetical protein